MSAAATTTTTSSSSWTETREQNLRLWIRQLVSLSLQFVQAARRTRVFSYVLTLISIIGGAYSIPGYGCTLMASPFGCIGLAWSGLILGFIVTVANGVTLAYDPVSKANTYDGTAKTLLRLSRTISLELEKPREDRKQSADFSASVVAEYDAALEGVRLPWYSSGEEQQLANISLLRSYNLSTATATEEPAAAQVLPAVATQITAADRAVMRKINDEISRLGSQTSFLESNFDARARSSPV